MGYLSAAPELMIANLIGRDTVWGPFHGGSGGQLLHAACLSSCDQMVIRWQRQYVEEVPMQTWVDATIKKYIHEEITSKMQAA
jgi:hypothetical protein